jgi:protein-L-isoaspartate(D-aspartate) O-methyltransferase
MVRSDIAGRDVSDPRVLDAMATVRRDRFVPERVARSAYDDRPLSIGAGQTISQPYVVAVMAERARPGPDDRVLEVGTGSGYGAAVLGHLAAEVWTIERHHELAEAAQERLTAEGMDNVHVVEGDGTRGWPSAAPYDAIVVTAGAPTVPVELLAQLADGGRLVIPVADRRGDEMLRCLTRRGDEVHEEDVFPVRFVPLVPDPAGPDPAGPDPGAG